MNAVKPWWHTVRPLLVIVFRETENELLKPVVSFDNVGQ